MKTWTYNDRPEGVRFVPERVAEPGRTEIEDEIWSWIVRGDDDPAEFVDYFDDDEARHGLTDGELEDAYARALDVRREQQAGFGAVETNLTAAFDELNGLGVVARENFACCGTCAAAEIHGERDDSRHWLGYVWYHQQDTDSLIASTDGSVYLGYGAYPAPDFDEAAYDALPDAEKEALYSAGVRRMLDDTVFPVLRRHGMEIEWNRSLGTRVLVTGAQWFEPV